jgi:LysM repeat protein
VVCVPSEQDANVILHDIKSETGCDPKEIEFKQTVRVARAPRNATPMSRHKAMRVVKDAVCPLIPRWAIIADGKAVVAVPSKEKAGETLDLAKLEFGKQVRNLAEEPQFKENVTVDISAVSPEIYKQTAEEAVDYLFTAPKPVSEDAVYTVKKGDVAGAIAVRCGLSLSELESLNRGTNLNRLQIGDKLHIKKIAPPKGKLTVVVRDLAEWLETVPAPVQKVSSAKLYTGKTAEISPGKSGQKRVKAAVIYENGVKTGTEVVHEQTIREPVPRRVAVAIRSR